MGLGIEREERESEEINGGVGHVPSTCDWGFFFILFLSFFYFLHLGYKENRLKN